MENREVRSITNKTLKSLCRSNGWSYAVFWRFHPPNHMLLTMEDAYFDKDVESVVNTMPPAQMLGEGIIGQAALDGNHRWMLLDALPEVCKAKGQFPSSNDSEFSTQVLFGMKTVAVIPVESCGVLQFGSTKDISETHEFLGKAKKFLLDENFVEVASGESVSSSLNCDHMDLNGMFASATSSSNFFPVSSEPFFETLGSCSTNDPFPFFAQTINESGMEWCGNGELILNPNSGSLVIDSICDDKLMDTFKEQYEPLQLPTSLFDSCQMDDVSQWFADSSDLCFMGYDAMVSENMSHTLEVDCKSSGLHGSDIFSGAQGKNCADSSHSSPRGGLKSTRESEHFVAPLDFRGQKFGDCREDIVNIISNKDDSLPVQTGSVISISECISGTEGGSTAAPRKGLFSELGLEHLFSDSPCTSTITKTYVDDECPTKRRKIESNHKVIGKQIQLSDHATGVKWKHPTSSGGLQECKPKSQTGLLIDDNYSRDVKSYIISGTNTQTRTEESVKTTKKRAKPGESTRPRPKDRQMIADRIKELRDIIPDGAKLSIDALLGRTIKHMVFMQSLAKHADKLKQVEKPKLIGETNSLVQNRGSSKSTSSGGSQSRGATWAYEVGGRNLFCPIVVEDLDHPGQMLIEMLCEDQGYLLEIADIVRDLGLTILKGVMEARDDKMWAHFIVEGNKHVNVTRIEVFVSLMQLLQGTCINSQGNKKIEPIVGKIENNEAQLASLWRNFQKQQVVI